MGNLNSICIIGAGNIGTRHLQGMVQLSHSANIYVVDTINDSLAKAKDIFDKTNGSKKHNVKYYNEISELPEMIDVAIIATSSNVRRMLIEKLLEKVTVHYLILEKVLFQKLDDYEFIQNLLDEKNVKAWINCPRRIYPSYIDLKQKLKSSVQFEISISGALWGMGCNTIHLLDLIAFLANSHEMYLNENLIEPYLLQSKRTGFYEIEGVITGNMGKCNSFIISSYPHKDEPIPVTITINSDVLKCIIYEGKKKIILADKETNWEFKEYNFDVPYLSQIAHKPVQEILNIGTTGLTTYEESKYLHKVFQGPLIEHFKKLGMRGELCPIT